MTEPKPPDREPPKPPLQLGYAAPNWWERPAGNVPFIAQVAIGFGAFVTACVLAAVMVATGRGGAPEVLIAPVMALVLLTFVGGVARRRWRWPGFAVGVLIGVGLALLAVGLCFVTFGGI